MRWPRPTRALGVVTVVAALSGATVVALAPPAAAHGPGGPEATNFDSRIVRVDPPTAAVDVDVIELGDRVAVTAAPGTEVVVLGYEGEPYLRVDARGVHENRRSPAVWANESRYLDDGAAAPPAFDAGARPVWVQTSSGRTARWHDHRVHWMARTDPPVVAADPDREHLLVEWTIDLLVDGRPVAVHGELWWIPGPSPWPWLLAALGLAAALVAAGRTARWAAVLATGVGALVVAEAVHLVGRWQGSDAPVGERFLLVAYSIAGIALGLGALALARRRRDPFDAVPAILIAAIVLTVAGGLADVAALGRSRLPTSLDPDLARALVVVSLGAGTATIVNAALRLARPVPAPAPA